MSAEPEVGEQLRFVQRQQGCDRLDFQHEAGFDDNVHLVFEVEPPAFVDDRQCHLLIEGQARVTQFLTEALLLC